METGKNRTSGLAGFELQCVVGDADGGLSMDEFEQFFASHGKAPPLRQATALAVQNQVVDVLAHHQRRQGNIVLLGDYAAQRHKTVTQG